MSDESPSQTIRTILTGLENWETVGEIVFTSATEEEAVSRIREALAVSEHGARAILDQDLRKLTRDWRARMADRATELDSTP